MAVFFSFDSSTCQSVFGLSFTVDLYSLQDEEEKTEDTEQCSDLVKNTNAQDVAAAARERREAARQEAQRKKDKDKEDRY